MINSPLELKVHWVSRAITNCTVSIVAKLLKTFISGCSQSVQELGD